MTSKVDDNCLPITVHLKCMPHLYRLINYWRDPTAKNLHLRNQKSRKTLHFLRKAPKRTTICRGNFLGKQKWHRLQQKIIQSQPTPKDFNKNYNGMVPVKGDCFPDLEKSNFCTGEAVPSQPFGYKNKC